LPTRKLRSESEKFSSAQGIVPSGGGDGHNAGAMTKTLFLLRHAKSSWDAPDLADHDRPLAKRGRKAGALLRRWFRAQAIRPDCVLVSSARRAQETLQALDLHPSTPVETLPSLYHAAPQAILDAIRGAPHAARVLLVIGHNPGLQDFAVLLGEDRWDPLSRRIAEGYPTGAVARFEGSRPWAEWTMGCAKLTGFTTPRALKG